MAVPDSDRRRRVTTVQSSTSAYLVYLSNWYVPTTLRLLEVWLSSLFGLQRTLSPDIRLPESEKIKARVGRVVLTENLKHDASRQVSPGPGSSNTRPQYSVVQDELEPNLAALGVIDDIHSCQGDCDISGRLFTSRYLKGCWVCILRRTLNLNRWKISNSNRS
jgi:hypothetical protein